MAFVETFFFYATRTIFVTYMSFFTLTFCCTETDFFLHHSVVPYLGQFCPTQVLGPNIIILTWKVFSPHSCSLDEISVATEERGGGGRGGEQEEEGGGGGKTGEKNIRARSLFGSSRKARVLKKKKKNLLRAATISRQKMRQVLRRRRRRRRRRRGRRASRPINCQSCSSCSGVEE